MLEACVSNALKKGEEKEEPFKLLVEEQFIIMYQTFLKIMLIEFLILILMLQVII